MKFFKRLITITIVFLLNTSLSHGEEQIVYLDLDTIVGSTKAGKLIINNLEKYKKVFLESLSINSDVFSDEIKYNDIAEWDSIGHMTLMSALEEEFKITLETDDIIDFSSYKKGMELLSSKYKVIF